MKLITTGLVLGLGYLLGRPQGRRRLAQLRGQLTDRVRNRGAERQQEPQRRPRPYPGVATESGFTGTTVAEDSRAVITGLPTPPLAARTQQGPSSTEPRRSSTTASSPTPR